jgi:hypothetical protein
VAETSIGRARRLAKEKREKREAQEAADKKAAEPKPEEEKESSSLLDSIRKAFSSADDISRIDAAVDAVTGGVSQANKDSKRKKK